MWQDWALGLWASKQRYASQEEIINVVRNYSYHNISVSAVVIDWKHYKCFGDWRFSTSPEMCWPNPTSMVASLKEMGVSQVVVSVHPWSQNGAETYHDLTEQGLCTKNSSGGMVAWGGKTIKTCQMYNTTNRGEPVCLYDASNPLAREYLWKRLYNSYYKHGITQFWTDGTEPAGGTGEGGLLPEDVRFHDSTGALTLPAASAFMYWPGPLAMLHAVV